MMDSMMEDESMQDAAMTDNDETMMNDKDDTMMEGDSSMMMESSDSFVGVGERIHDVEGFARVVYVEGGSDVLRLENLMATNGPDLYVYVATDKEASDFVSIGRLKANNGNQNYDIPEAPTCQSTTRCLCGASSFQCCLAAPS